MEYVFITMGGTIIDDNSGSIADGNFHHFLFVSRSATDQQMYVDGSSVGTSTASKTLPSALTVFEIGNYSPLSQLYNGGLLVVTESVKNTVPLLWVNVPAL